MKTQIKYTLLGLAVVAVQTVAQPLSSSVQEQQITGTWPCAVTVPANGGVYEVAATAQYQKGGLSKHNDSVLFTADNGETIKMKVDSIGQWRYEPSTQRMYEALRTVKVSYDEKNPLASTVGALYQKTFQDSIGQEQASYVVLLNDKQWISVIGDAERSMIKVSCQRN